MKTNLNFKYRPKFSIWYFTPFVSFGLIASYAFYLKSAIPYKYIRKLTYPNNLYIFGGLALLCLLYALYKIYNVLSVDKSNSINIYGNTISFKKKSNKINLNANDISQICIDNDEDDGESIVICSKKDNKRYEFFEDYFESVELYIQFKSIVEQLHKENNTIS
jgi:hypothetical protein